MTPKGWWSKKRVELLKRLWAEGFWASQIATELGTTRGSVIGKVHRLGLPQPTTHQPQSPRKVVERSRSRPVPHEPPTVAKFTFIEPTGPVHFKDLDKHHCRWMPGDASDMLFCGKTKIKGSPYCAQHTRASYTTARSQHA